MKRKTRKKFKKLTPGVSCTHLSSLKSNKWSRLALTNFFVSSWFRLPFWWQVLRLRVNLFLKLLATLFTSMCVILNSCARMDRLVYLLHFCGNWVYPSAFFANRPNFAPICLPQLDQRVPMYPELLA